MKVRRFAAQLGWSLIGVVVLTSVSHSRALAQDHDRPAMTSRHQPQPAEQKKHWNPSVSSDGFNGQNQ